MAEVTIHKDYYHWLIEQADRLAEAEALLREIYGRDRHFDSGAWLIRMYHNDYARIHAFLAPDSASGCQHDLLEPNPTVMVSGDGKRAVCCSCKQAWTMPSDQPEDAVK